MEACEVAAWKYDTQIMGVNRRPQVESGQSSYLCSRMSALVV